MRRRLRTSRFARSSIKENRGRLTLIEVSLDIENYCTIRASPACQRRFYSFCLLVSKIKGRDCGTINGHDESGDAANLLI
ncbi:hypothetical protein B6V69_26180 [Escherichia coli]|nr:hypothetical protein [Escherichia coli]ORC94356.1 hypothetical protein A4T34_27060 [Escherichia coli]